MKEFSITWVKTPVDDILGIGTLGISCGVYCEQKTPDSCVYYCIGDQCTSHNRT